MNQFSPHKLRQTILDLAFNGSTAHVACAFSIVEILSVLYREFLRFPENNPSDVNRDYFILSKGHGVMAQYACMRELGWLNDQDIVDYFENGTRLTGLADSHVRGIETSTGSLGHGLSVAVGLALGSKWRKTDQRTFVLVGDGEINEGTVWEAALFANHHHLDKLTVIVDANGLQAMGSTDEVMELGSIREKFEAFGFEAAEVDGHDTKEISSAISRLLGSKSHKPTALVCHTIKGKGVSFMESDNIWHYTRLTEESYNAAKIEINGE